PLDAPTGPSAPNPTTRPEPNRARPHPQTHQRRPWSRTPTAPRRISHRSTNPAKRPTPAPPAHEQPTPQHQQTRHPHQQTRQPPHQPAHTPNRNQPQPSPGKHDPRLWPHPKTRGLDRTPNPP